MFVCLCDNTAILSHTPYRGCRSTTDWAILFLYTLSQFSRLYGRPSTRIFSSFIFSCRDSRMSVDTKTHTDTSHHHTHTPHVSGISVSVNGWMSSCRHIFFIWYHICKNRIEVMSNFFFSASVSVVLYFSYVTCIEIFPYWSYFISLLFFFYVRWQVGLYNYKALFKQPRLCRISMLLLYQCFLGASYMWS